MLLLCCVGLVVAGVAVNFTRLASRPPGGRGIRGRERGGRGSISGQPQSGGRSRGMGRGRRGVDGSDVAVAAAIEDGEVDGDGDADAVRLVLREEDDLARIHECTIVDEAAL